MGQRPHVGYVLAQPWVPSTGATLAVMVIMRPQARVKTGYFSTRTILPARAFVLFIRTILRMFLQLCLRLPARHSSMVMTAMTHGPAETDGKNSHPRGWTVAP